MISSPTNKSSRYIKLIAFVLSIVLCLTFISLPTRATELDSSHCYSVTEGFSFNATSQIAASWDNHANVEVIFTNTGDTRIDNWYFTFSTTYCIENIWNAYIVETDNQGTYTITNTDWNQDIPVGGSVSIGMTLASDDSEITSLPEAFLLNTREKQVDSTAYSIEYIEYSSYDTGFNGGLTISVSEIIEDWSINCAPNRQITEVSSAYLIENDDDTITIKNDGYNQNIPAGSTYYIGLLGENSEEEFSLGDVTLTTVGLAYSLIDDLNENGIPDYAELMGQSMETTVTPTPTVEPEPTVTPTEEVTATPTVTEEPTTTPSPTATVSPLPSDTSTPTPTEIPVTNIPTVTETPTPTEEPITVTPTPTDIDIEMDSDSDGLSDFVEDYLGTDKNDPDTDQDGLTDYTEIMYGYDPLDPDTDDDGITDSTEDLDEDGLDNLFEQNLGTLLDIKDSDGDGLYDAEELEVYGTDPTLYDTDGDGVNDGDEVKLGKEPTEPSDGSTRITQTINIDLSNSDPSGIEGIDITCDLAGDINRVIRVESVYNIDTYATGVQGRVGVPFDIDCSEEIEGATLTITYSDDVDDSDLGVIWIDSSTGMIVLLDNAEINTENNTVTVELEHFSTYSLVNLATWSSALSRGVSTTTNTQNCDFLFVINSSSDETIRNRELETIRSFVEHIRPGDRIGLIINDGSTQNDTCIVLDNSLDHTMNLIEQAEDFLEEEHRRDDYCYSFICVEDMLSGSNPTKVYVLTDRTSDWLLMDDLNGHVLNYSGYDTAIVLMGEDRNSEGQSVAADFGFKYYPYPICEDLWFHDMGSGTGKAVDTDHDGLSDWQEINGIMGIDGNMYYSDPTKKDTDGDGLNDRVEMGNIYTFTVNTSGLYKVYSNGLLVFDEAEQNIGRSRIENLINIARKRFDLSEGEELVVADIISNPQKPDTDGDGYTDFIDHHPMISDKTGYTLGINHTVLLNELISNNDEYIGVASSNETPTDNGLYSYGGDQGWFSDHLHINGTNVYDFPDYGCGVIAATDVSLYVNNGVSYYTFNEYAPYVENNICYVTGLQVPNRKYPVVLQSDVIRILESNGLEAEDSPALAILSYYTLQDIIDSIKNDHPVILREMGWIDEIKDWIDNNIHDFGFDTGIGLYRANENDIEAEPSKSMCWHYVTITGVYTNTQTGEVYLKVQSWGSSYYIDYSEFNDYNSGLLRSGRLIFVS